MVRFFEIVKSNQVSSRKLNLSDCGLGDTCINVVAKIIKKSTVFAQVDLSKNDFTNEGLRVLAETLRDFNSTIVHLNIGGNHIGPEGTMHLFQALQGHPSLVSLNLANNDCHKHKIKIGQKSAEALKFLLTSPGCLLTHLNLTDNAMTGESLINILEGVSQCPSLVTLDLAQNDFSSNPAVFTALLSIFSERNSLQELILNQNQLTDKHIDELSNCLAKAKDLALQRLDLSSNKISYKGANSLLTACLVSSSHLTSIILDRTQLEKPVVVDNAYFQFCRNL